jgi:hypothetical protein
VEVLEGVHLTLEFLDLTLVFVKLQAMLGSKYRHLVLELPLHLGLHLHVAVLEEQDLIVRLLFLALQLLHVLLELYGVTLVPQLHVLELRLQFIIDVLLLPILLFTNN